MLKKPRTVSRSGVLSRFVFQAQTVLRQVGLGVVARGSLERLESSASRLAKLEQYIRVTQALGREFSWKEYSESSSQINQDIVANWVSEHQESQSVSDRQKVFVEIGAADGVENSNSCWLEGSKGWRGLLVEPNPLYSNTLRLNRPRAKIDNRAASSVDEPFADFILAGQFSSFSSTADSDFHAFRRKGKHVQVPIVSAERILEEAQIPYVVDFLSIDTEGSELDILKSIDFSKHEFRFISIEHNYVEPRRSEILSFLSKVGFRRVLKELSQFDDWYVQRSFGGLSAPSP